MWRPYAWDAPGARIARAPRFPFERLPPLVGFPQRPGVEPVSQKTAPDYYGYIVASGSVAPAAYSNINLVIEQDSDFELIAITGVFLPSGNSTYQQPNNAPQWFVGIEDTMSQRNLFQSNIINSASPQPYMAPLNLICGSAQFPHVLPVPRRFMSQSTIQFTFYNLDSAITGAWSIALHGRKIYREGADQSLFQSGKVPRFRTWRGKDGRMWQEDYFAYNFSLNSLANGVTTTINFNMDAFSDFEWINAGASCPPRNTTTGASITANTALLTAQISEGSSQRRLFSSAVPVGDFFGAGQQPFQLPQTRVLPKNDLVRLSVTNNDSVTFNNLNFLFEGRKIFGMGA